MVSDSVGHWLQSVTYAITDDTRIGSAIVSNKTRTFEGFRRR
jgi:hypothetical protein